jgi:hypothetical protein
MELLIMVRQCDVCSAEYLAKRRKTGIWTIRRTYPYQGLGDLL